MTVATFTHSSSTFEAVFRPLKIFVNKLLAYREHTWDFCLVLLLVPCLVLHPLVHLLHGFLSMAVREASLLTNVDIIPHATFHTASEQPLHISHFGTNTPTADLMGSLGLFLLDHNCVYILFLSVCVLPDACFVHNPRMGKWLGASHRLSTLYYLDHLHLSQYAVSAMSSLRAFVPSNFCFGINVWVMCSMSVLRR